MSEYAHGGMIGPLKTTAIQEAAERQYARRLYLQTLLGLEPDEHLAALARQMLEDTYA